MGEYERVQEKAAATDSAFLSYLSIGVTPFLAFTAYAVSEQKFQIFLAALPILSVLGMSVVLVLSTHYVYAGAYLEYLEGRINDYIGKCELRDSDFARIAYKVKMSPVMVSYVVALTALFGMNLAAVPAINVFVGRFPATHPNVPVVYRNAMACYWQIVLPFLMLAGGLFVFSFWRVAKRLRRSKDVALVVMKS